MHLFPVDLFYLPSTLNSGVMHAARGTEAKPLRVPPAECLYCIVNPVWHEFTPIRYAPWYVSRKHFQRSVESERPTMCIFPARSNLFPTATSLCAAMFSSNIDGQPQSILMYNPACYIARGQVWQQCGISNVRNTQVTITMGNARRLLESVSNTHHTNIANECMLSLQEPCCPAG